MALCNNSMIIGGNCWHRHFSCLHCHLKELMCWLNLQESFVHLLEVPSHQRWDGLMLYTSDLQACSSVLCYQGTVNTVGLVQLGFELLRFV